MKTGDIIVIDKVVDDSYDGKEYKKVTDKAGNTFNIKQGRGGKLKDKWSLLEEGAAIELTIGEYNNKSFVSDFTVVKDEFKKQAAEKVQAQVETERNDSIEAQVAFKGMVELIATGIVKTNTDEYKATIRWAMGRMCLPTVIMNKIEEVKSETTKDTSDNQEAQEKPATGQDSGEYPKTTGEFLDWIMKRDPNIKAPRLWLQAEHGVTGNEILTMKRIRELYDKIKGG